MSVGGGFVYNVQVFSLSVHYVLGRPTVNAIINHFESSRKTLIIMAVYITSVSIDRLFFNCNDISIDRREVNILTISKNVSCGVIAQLNSSGRILQMTNI